MERTLVLVKPDAIQRGLAMEVLGRLERRGRTLRLGISLRVMTRQFTERGTPRVLLRTTFYLASR